MFFMRNALMVSIYFFLCAFVFAEEVRIPLKKDRLQKTKFLEVKDGEELKYFNSQTAKENVITQKDFTILNWNVFKGVKRTLYYKYPAFAQNFDFILLQEAYTTPEMLKMFESTSHQYTLAGSFIYKPLQVTTGVATGTKFVSIKDTPLRSKYKEPIVDAAQMCLSTEYKIAGSTETLLIVNVHAINFVLSEYLFHQLDQLKDHIKAHKGPVIFAGDFNVWDEKKTKYLRRIVKELKLSEVELNPDVRKRFRDHVLDYVFYRGMKLRYAKVHNMKDMSDHNPIEVGFTLP